MYLQSKFKLWAFLLVGVLLSITGLLVAVTSTLLERQSMPNVVVFVFLATFLLFIWIWLVFGELRTKIIKVEIQGREIIVSNYLGLGTKKVYYFSQFEGFETALLPSTYDTYEYLYLINEGKKVIKLSQFYHSNYEDLKDELTNKVQDLGQKEFSLLKEVKEIFI